MCNVLAYRAPTGRVLASRGAHGSKLNAVANKLKQIRREDATAKAIVFVQWADLEAQVRGGSRGPGLSLAQHRATALPLLICIVRA